MIYTPLDKNPKRNYNYNPKQNFKEAYYDQ